MYSSISAPLVYESEFTFRGVPYTLTLEWSGHDTQDAATSSILLRLRVPSFSASSDSPSSSQVDSHDMEWSARFSVNDVEQMSRKTGEFLSFHEFACMVATLLGQGQQESMDANPTAAFAHRNPVFDTASIDVLTYADLEELKRKRMGATGGRAPPARSGAETPRSRSRRAQNKRYLIVTASSSTQTDDKIHYPLPLPCAPATNNGNIPSQAQSNSSAAQAQPVPSSDQTVGLSSSMQHSASASHVVAPSQNESSALSMTSDSHAASQPDLSASSYGAPPYSGTVAASSSPCASPWSSGSDLRAQLNRLQEALTFEKDVSRRRVAALEDDNRSLRRDLAATKVKLATTEEALRAITDEADKLKQKVAEFVSLASSQGGVGTMPATKRGRSRNTSPRVNTNAESLSSTAPNGVSARSRAGTPSPSRGAKANVPPLPVSSARSPSPSIPSSQRKRSLSQRSESSTSRTGSASPLRRFDATKYVEHKRAVQAAKEAAMREKTREEIRRATMPLPRRGSSRSPARRAPVEENPSSPSYHSQYSNSWRGPRVPPRTFEYLDSPGRAARSLSGSPDLYVSTPHQRSRKLQMEEEAALEERERRRVSKSRPASARPTHRSTGSTSSRGEGRRMNGRLRRNDSFEEYAESYSLTSSSTLSSPAFTSDPDPDSTSTSTYPLQTPSAYATGASVDTETGAGLDDDEQIETLSARLNELKKMVVEEKENTNSQPAAYGVASPSSAMARLCIA